ncbi:MAG: hypothetical protein SGBAC_002207 [Bacillariaceae sp.]
MVAANAPTGTVPKVYERTATENKQLYQPLASEMIPNIESIDHVNGGDSVTLDDGYDFGGGYDVELGSLDYSDDKMTLSIDTLRSHLSLPSLHEEVQGGQAKMPEISFAASMWDSQSISQEDLEEAKHTHRVVKSPFLKKPLPIPNFNKIDDRSTTTTVDGSDVGNLHKATTQLPSDRPAGDPPFASDSDGDGDSDSDSDSTLEGTPLHRSSRKRKHTDFPENHLGDRINHAETNHTLDPQSLRRSSRQRKPFDLAKWHLEAPSSDSENEHCCSGEGGRLGSVRYSPRACDKQLLDEGSSEPQEYGLRSIVSRRIKEDAEVPVYEYLCRWEPTWEPANVVDKKRWKGEGAWKLMEILDTKIIIVGGRYVEECLCQWADSWEPEDNINDEALRVAQIKFRDGKGNEDNDSDDSRETDYVNDDSDACAGNFFSFHGVVYDTYLEMVIAKRENNKRVLRQIMKQKMNEGDNSNICNDADE